MAVVKMQIMCDHFENEEMLHELIGDINGALRRADFAFQLTHQSLGTHTTLSNGEDLRQVMGVVVVEVVTTKISLLLGTIRLVLEPWDLGEFGGWVVTARLDYNGIHENPLSEIELMNFLLDKQPDKEETPF